MLLSVRFIYASIGILLAAVLLTGDFCSGASLRWIEYPKVFSTAKEKGKPVLLYFYMPGCQYCKTLDEQYFADAGIRKMMTEDFVLSRVDGTAQRDIAAEFEVMAYPTVWLLNAKGERLVKIPGLLEKGEYRTFLEYAGKGQHRTMDLRSYLRSKSRSKY